jgi:DNA-binding protein H-NS
LGLLAGRAKAFQMDLITMDELDLESLGFDELWLMHERLTKILSDRIAAEKVKLESRLAQLNQTDAGRHSKRLKIDGATRRSYPKVLPKYCNPLSPTETWSGRGKQPRWLVTALKSGEKLETFKIESLKKTLKSE